MAAAPALVDRHGRAIGYPPSSVTDPRDPRRRCRLAEPLTFLTAAGAAPAVARRMGVTGG